MNYLDKQEAKKKLINRLKFGMLGLFAIIAAAIGYPVASTFMGICSLFFAIGSF